MKLAALNAPARHPIGTIFISLFIATFAILSTLQLHPDTSLQSLFTPGQPAVVALNHVLNDFPTAEELLVLVTTPGDQPQPDKLLAFADSLKQQASKDPQVSQLVSAVSFRADAQSREFVTKVIVPNAIFYLSDADFESALQRLSRAEMAEQFHHNEAMLAAPGPAAGALASALLRDPLRLHEFIESRLTTMQPFKTYQNSDAFLSSDGRSLLIRITGAKPPSDLQFCRRITAAVTDLAQRVNSDHLMLEFSGAYPIAAQSERSIRRDSISSVIGSIVSLGLLFAVIFRRSILLFVMTFLPVVLGVLYGFGMYALINTNVTPLTAVIGAMLAGIGIDYSVFYMVHYQQQRSEGNLPIDAAEKTIRQIGGALVAAWITSVVGFIAVGFTTVRMLRDFSIVGSLGLAGAMLGAIFILPALLVLLDRYRVLPIASARISLRPLLSWIDRHSGLCVAICSLIIAVAITGIAIGGPWLTMETDPTVLHPHPNPPLDAEAHIAQRMGTSPDSVIVYLQADSAEELLSVAYQVQEKIAGATSTFGLANLLPDPAKVQRRIGRVGPTLADQVLADFDAVVAQSAFSADAYRSYRDFLRRLLTPTSAPGIAELKQYEQLAQAMLPRPETASNEAMTIVFSQPGMDRQEDREKSVSQLRELLSDVPGATVTGMTVLSLDTQSTIRRDLPKLIIAALTICVLYLLIHFRSLKDTLLALLPTAFSLACLLAIAKLFGAKMNLANIVAVPLLVGIDVDYGIFLLSVARRSKTRSELFANALSTGLAVMLCASATVLGFGSLAFTSVPAVRSLGWAVAIGVVTCAISSLFFLFPLLLRSRRFNLPIVVAICFLGLMIGGCSPPSGRLSFPTEVLAHTQNCDWYDVHHNGKKQFGVAYDSSGNVDRLIYSDGGDGRADREYRLTDYANDSVPHLILLLDSIPFQTIQERYKSGDFRWFGEPQKMIAPFPSLTEICYSDILRCPPMPGAIDNYFDPRDEKMKKIVWDRVLGYEQPWERRSFYRANFMQEGLSFLHPDNWYAAELEQARLAVERSPDRVTVVYLGTAASMVCKYGKNGAEQVLDGARRLCLQLLYERRGAIKISMMADHGHNYVESKNISLEQMLSSAGFHRAKKLRGPKDFIVELDALVTYVGVDTLDPDAVAKTLCTHKPIELAIYMQGPRAMIRSAAGTAAIECRNGQLRYVPVDADVLGYSSLIAQLKSDGEMDADGFASDQVWFHRTLDHQWPNVPRRVWDALHGKMINPPSVMLSLKDGYYAGYPEYEKYIKMASTHGGLNQINSATFVMTMTGRLHEAVRHQDVIQVLEPGFEPAVQK
jgi:predicted RND superfamily exporter protein